MALTTLLLLRLKEEEKETKRKIWSRKWLLRRKQLGCYENLMKELALEDNEGYRRWIRMDCDDFQYLLEKVSPLICKQDTNMRKAIPAAERLALTLRFLATGETQSSLAYQFRIAQNTVSTILPEVCDAIYNSLVDVFTVPNTEEDWIGIAEKFNEMWQFPMCIGALDGKHVKIIPPPGSGSTYYNYKGDFSIVLLALVDAELKFIYADVGTNGRISDGGVWGKSTLKKALEENELNIPQSGVLPGTNTTVPYVIVADDAFPLKTNIMKPYPGRSLTTEKMNFNYRLSRARRVVENAFGILAARFQIFKCAIKASTDNVQKFVLAACALHNFLRVKKSYSTQDEEEIVSHLQSLKNIPIKPSNHAKYVQDVFCDYFNNIGAIPWQNKMRHLH